MRPKGRMRKNGMNMSKPFPDGLSQRNIDSRGGAGWLAPVLLTALMAAGLAGMFGGQPSPVKQVAGQAVTLKVTAPDLLRNGLIFETTIEVRARQPVNDLVIAVSDTLWRDMTINSMIPAASEESYENGFRRFSFGELKPGDVFRFKIDGQINPPLTGGTSGVIAVFDGERKLTSTPISMKVLP